MMVKMIRTRLFYIKYLAACGIILLGTWLVYIVWDTGCEFGQSSSSSSSLSRFRNGQGQGRWKHLESRTKLITLVSVMCHGLNQSSSTSSSSSSTRSGSTASKITATSRKGISRQMSQMQVMLKSLLLMEHEYLIENGEQPDSNHPTLQLILYTDYKEYYDQIVHYLYNSGEFHTDYLKQLKLVYAPVVYPKGYEHLKYFFRPCTTLRLFMDRILPSHPEVVYLDTDIIFLKPVRSLYHDFYSFNTSQWCGMGMDWYHHHGHPIPYYGSQGLNAGVGIYNLSRMRASEFSSSLDYILDTYLNKTRFADQDILNIYFHFHPEQLHLLPCNRNYIPNYCRTDNLCPSASTESGITILHGITMTFMPESYESQFVTTFNYYKTLQLASIARLDQVEQNLRERLCENERKIRLNFIAQQHDDEHCARNLKFADELFGQRRSAA